MPFSERIVGDFIESYGFKEQLRRLINSGFVTGITATNLNDDSTIYPFRGSLDSEIFHRFDRPVYRVASAIYLQGIPHSPMSPVMALWTPFPGFGTGSATRGFSLDIAGGGPSYAVADANNDNANWSSISINGQVVVTNNYCCENYWRRTGWDVFSVTLEAWNSWSQSAPMFNLAVVADNLTFSNVTQTPTGGLSNNHPPIVSKLLPGVWNRIE